MNADHDKRVTQSSLISPERVSRCLRDTFIDAALPTHLADESLVSEIFTATCRAFEANLSRKKAREDLCQALEAAGIDSSKKPGKLAHNLYRKLRNELSEPDAERSEAVTQHPILDLPYSDDPREFRTYRFDYTGTHSRKTEHGDLQHLFEMMPTDIIPFSNRPAFDEFFSKFEILLRAIHRLLFVPPPGEQLDPNRVGTTRRGLPRTFRRDETRALVDYGDSFISAWDNRFSDTLGRACTVLPIIESDAFVGRVEDHVQQIRNSLLLMASEARPGRLMLFECVRVLKGVSHVRLLGPHDRLQDSFVVIAAMNHLLRLAAQLRSENDMAALWSENLLAQKAYGGEFRLPLDKLISMTIVRGMDPDLYDTSVLTPRALIEEDGYSPDALTEFGQSVWPEGPVGALLQMFDDIPDAYHDAIDGLLVDAFSVPHEEWQNDAWLQSPYTSVTLATAMQIFLNVLSVPFNSSLPIADIALFPIFRRQVVDSLTDEKTEFSSSLGRAIDPTLDDIEEETFFAMPDDFPKGSIKFGPTHRRVSGPRFSHMPAAYRENLCIVADRKHFARLAAFLRDVD